MTNKEEECTLCGGRGDMTNENYETGDCIACDGTGFVLVFDYEQSDETTKQRR
jgi:RecJ-like exonuclease